MRAHPAPLGLVSFRFPRTSGAIQPLSAMSLISSRGAVLQQLHHLTLVHCIYALQCIYFLVYCYNALLYILIKVNPIHKYLFSVLCSTLLQSIRSLQLTLSAIQRPQAPQCVSDCGTAGSREKTHQLVSINRKKLHAGL